MIAFKYCALPPGYGANTIFDLNTFFSDNSIQWEKTCTRACEKGREGLINQTDPMHLYRTKYVEIPVLNFDHMQMI